MRDPTQTLPGPPRLRRNADVGGEADGRPGLRGPRAFYHSTVEFLRDLPGTAKRFWILVVLTGLSAGLGAVFLVKFLAWIQTWAWGASAHGAGGHGELLGAVMSSGAWRRVLVPVAGGMLVVITSLIARQPLRGHGTAGIIESIWVRSGRMPLARALFRGVVSIAAVGMGAPLGREGALLQTGAATGSSLARKLKIPADQARLLVACGAAAGISAAYNVPIGGALFGLEVLLGSFALELFGPIVVSCVVATVVSRVLIADHPSYIIPHYTFTNPRELLLAVGFGPVLGLASALYVRTVNTFSVLLEKVPAIVALFLPLAAMTGVGLSALWLPELLGNGYDSVNAALLGHVPITLLLVLPFAKMVATSVTAGAGVPGGLFTPSLFYGALIGGALGKLAGLIWATNVPSGAYTLMGMAAVLAGTTHASVSSVLIIFELTGSYEVILPLMLSSVISAAVSRRLEPESLYTSVLKRRNVSLPESPHPSWLRSTSVSMLLEDEPVVVAPNAPFDEVVVKMLDAPAGHDLYVTGKNGRYMGTLVLDELKGHIPDHSLLSMTVAADVMDIRIKPVQLDLSLSEVAIRFSNTSLERLPVVDRNRKLLGTISKGDVLRHGRF